MSTSLGSRNQTSIVPSVPAAAAPLLVVSFVLLLFAGLSDGSSQNMRLTALVIATIIGLLGGALAGPASSGASSLYEKTPSSDANPTLGGWAVAVIVFGWIGGLIGYLVLNAEQPARARHVAKWGLIWSGIWLGAYAVFMLLIVAVIF